MFRDVIRVAIHDTRGLPAHEMALRIYRLFVELNRLGTTVIIATHDQDLVGRSARPVLHLEKGRLRPVIPEGPAS